MTFKLKKCSSITFIDKHSKNKLKFSIDTDLYLSLSLGFVYDLKMHDFKQLH